jgi:hypothetical protein
MPAALNGPSYLATVLPQLLHLCLISGNIQWEQKVQTETGLPQHKPA